MKRKSSDGERHRHSRKRSYRIHKRAKLRETVGILNSKESLNVALLNVDGLNETQFNIVNSTISAKSPDICVILETKFRKEQVGLNVKIDGYDHIDRRRSNASLDRPGGGLVMYTRNDDGCQINEYIPTISNPDHAFVHNERIWVTVTSSKFKTAVCGVYFGFQAGDDRHGPWNDILYNVLQDEIFELPQSGFRILIVKNISFA